MVSIQKQKGKDRWPSHNREVLYQSGHEPNGAAFFPYPKVQTQTYQCIF